MAWTKAQVDRVLGEIMQRSQRDPAFRRLCLDNPAVAVKQIAGEDLPAGFTLRFVDNSNADMTVVLPDPVAAGSTSGELSDAELAGASGGVLVGLNQPMPGINTFAGGVIVSKPSAGFCFAAGTPVLMGDGSTRAIEQIAVGDAVLAYDERGRRVMVDTVAKILHHEQPQPLHRAAVEGLESDLILTTNHPFYVAGQWRAIRDLAPRTELFHFDPSLREASPRRLLSVTATDRTERVYNIEVEHVHTYFAGGLLVHNGAVGNK